jgi:glycosyltransferase involved in cell wall biosynthesis
MKVVLVIQHGKIGGIEQHVLTLAKGLKSNGLTPIVVMLFSGGPMVALFKEAQIKYEVLNGKNGHDIAMALRFRQFLKREKPDIIHMHTVTLVGAIVMWTASDIPLVITEHMAKMGRDIPGKTKLIYMISHARASKIIAVSESTRQSLVSFNPALEHKVLTMYNGIDVVSSDIVNLREELSLKAQYIVGAVGRLDVGKGWDSFIKTAALVNKKVENCHFVIMGDGPMKEELEAMVVKYEVNENIHFLGFRNDVRAVLKSFDLYLLLSEYEACPLSLLEAMVEKVPVTGFLPVGGVEEINAGIYPLLKQRDIDILAEQVIDMLSSKDDLEKMKKNAYERITDSFNASKMFSQVIALYKEVVER